MGMFDTLVLEKPQKCPNCGKNIYDIQTKYFENIMALYYINDVVSGPEEQNLFKEEVFCTKCVKFVKNVCVVVKYGILIGIKEDYEEAENLLKDYDKLGLIDTVHTLSKENINCRRRMRGAINGVDSIIKWFDRTKAEIAKEELLRNPKFTFFDSNVRGKDIMTALKDYKDDLEEDGSNIM